MEIQVCLKTLFGFHNYLGNFFLHFAKICQKNLGKLHNQTKVRFSREASCHNDERNEEGRKVSVTINIDFQDL